MILANGANMKEKTSTGGHKANARLRRIEGRHNAQVKELRQAFARGELTSDGYCAIEGFRILDEAIRSGLRFRTVFFSESAATRAEKLLSQLGAQVETLLLPDKLFASAVPSDDAPGCGRVGALEGILTRRCAGQIRSRPPAGHCWSAGPREIWGRSCAQRRPSAPAECCSVRERSARSILKSCELQQVRYSGCRWRARNCLTL